MTLVRTLLVSFGLYALPLDSRAQTARTRRLEDFDQWLEQLKETSGYHTEANFLEAIDGLEQVILASTSTAHRAHLLEDFLGALFLIFMNEDSFDNGDPVYSDVVREKAKELFLNLCEGQAFNIKPVLRSLQDQNFLQHCMKECRKMLESPHLDDGEANSIGDVMLQVNRVILNSSAPVEEVLIF